jgi:hypothetical protein
MEENTGDEVERLTGAVRALARSVADLAAELREVRGKVLPLPVAKRISVAAEETERVARDIVTRL